MARTVPISYTFGLISNRPKKNYLLDGNDWQHLVNEDSDGR
jgi:hypothetical protein